MSLRIDDDAWIAGATLIHDFACDAVFEVERTLLRDVGRDDLEALRGPLRAAGLPSVDDGYVATAALVGREQDLAGYYQRLIAVLTRRGRTEALTRPFPHFRVQPLILSAGTGLTEFSWVDSVPETASVLEALAGAPAGADADGLVWDDLDQGWAVRILARGETTYLVEWNWEDEADVPAGYGFRTDALADQAAGALERLTAMHRHLVQALGRDYWSYIPPAGMGRSASAGAVFGRGLLSLAGWVRRRRK
ncbi:MAG: hypothetical protein WA840_19985 [Caulobacteraceae bacterium]